MKDTIVFLMSYPLWIKAVVVALLSICALLLLVFKPDVPKDPAPPPIPSVAINVGMNQGGNVAGRDIVVNAGPAGAQTEELVRVLQARANRIHKDLAANFKYVEVNKFLQEFDKLHEAHVIALKRNNLVEAHEYLTQIHSVSRDLQSSEFWARHAKESPGVVYSLAPEAFQRGKMIQWYAGDQGMELLVAAAMGSWGIGSAPGSKASPPKALYEQLVK